jgi:hypothetical protein
MNIRMKLLATAAVAGALIAGGAQAAPAKKHHPRPSASANQALLDEVRALRAEVTELRGKVDSQASAQATTQQQIEATQSQVQAVQTQVAAAPAMSADQVNSQIAKAIDKEHHNDKFFFKGITLTPGGFLELAGIYRQHYEGNDVASSFSIPFPNNHQYHTSEGRFTARQSRVSFLAEGAVNPRVKLSMYGEFDFLGGAQTANSNQSNSYNPRIRNLYATADWNNGNSGWHVLVGQSWSLVTLNSKGITPRNEVPPSVIEAQYVPGFVWSRQPGIRVTGDFLDHKLWVAVSAENPQTTFGGTVPSSITNNAPAGSGFDSGNTLSLNHIPDFIGKVAYEDSIGGHVLHIEGFGLYRSFEAHRIGDGNVTAHGHGFGGGLTFQVVPKLLDVQISGMTGAGIGRYGTSTLPDVTFGPDGSIHAMKESMALAGVTVHATPMLDVYGYAGQEWEQRKDLGAVSTTLYGIGNPLLNNSGCFIEGGTCNGNTRLIRQYTIGAWQKIYQGSFGKAMIGLQFSHTERILFSTDANRAPEAKQNMGFISFRYYPF